MAPTEQATQAAVPTVGGRPDNFGLLVHQYRLWLRRRRHWALDDFDVPHAADRDAAQRRRTQEDDQRAEAVEVRQLQHDGLGLRRRDR